jgi:hypothetical protein
MRLYLIILLGICSVPAISQSIQNIKATPQADKVIITYDLTGTRPDQKFSLALFGSHDNFSKALTKVNGDVGQNITPGTGKKIIWDAALEFSVFKKDITFKVKGEVMPLPFVFKKPTVNGSARRGKNTSIKWEGGKPSQQVKLELFKGTESVTTIAEVGNTGQYTWRIPKKQDKGSYTMRLMAGQEVVNSSDFKIKSKTPFIVKVLPFVAVGGAAAFLLGGGESGSNDLPWAPDPD